MTEHFSSEGGNLLDGTASAHGHIGGVSAGVAVRIQIGTSVLMANLAPTLLPVSNDSILMLQQARPNSVVGCAKSVIVTGLRRTKSNVTI